MQPTRILMVETRSFSHFFKNALRQSASNVEIVGVVTNTNVALHMMRRHHPDVLIIDMRQPTVGTKDTLLKMRSQYPQAPIIGRTHESNDEFIFWAITAGVRGFINEWPAFSELIEAIRLVRQGQAYLPKNIARKFLLKLQEQPQYLH